MHSFWHAHPLPLHFPYMYVPLTEGFFMGGLIVLHGLQDPMACV
ncbi:MAG: hypothetical protein ACK5EW_00205 [Bacteroidota bacterium]